MLSDHRLTAGAELTSCFLSLCMYLHHCVCGAISHKACALWICFFIPFQPVLSVLHQGVSSSSEQTPPLPWCGYAWGHSISLTFSSIVPAESWGHLLSLSPVAPISCSVPVLSAGSSSGLSQLLLLQSQCCCWVAAPPVLLLALPLCPLSSPAQRV